MNFWKSCQTKQASVWVLRKCSFQKNEFFLVSKPSWVSDSQGKMKLPFKLHSNLRLPGCWTVGHLALTGDLALLVETLRNKLRWGIGARKEHVFQLTLSIVIMIIIISLSGISIPDKVLSSCTVRPSVSYLDFSGQTARPIQLKLGSNVLLLIGNGDRKARSGHVT